MDKLIVDDLHLSYGTNPILKGVSFELKAGESCACSARRAAARPRCCARWPASNSRPTAASSSTIACSSTARSASTCPSSSVRSPCSSRTRWPHVPSPTTSVTLKLRRVAPAEQKRRVQSALDQLGLGHLAERFPHQLSAASSSASRLRARSSTTRR